MDGFRTFLASFRFSSSRFESYYGKVIGQGSGYPTADEARKDVAGRDRMMRASTLANVR